MNCPVCGVPLVMSERQGVEIDYCPTCRGVWLDRGELDKVIERAGRGAPASSGAPLSYRDDDDDSYRAHRGASAPYGKGNVSHHRERENPITELFDFF